MEFIPAWGPRLMPHHKEKKERITEALTDLQLVIAGIANLGEGPHDGKEIAQMVAALARPSSVFLRKLVLGEPRNPRARLLDDGVLGSLDMRLQPLRKIPQHARRTLETGTCIEAAHFVATRLDVTTGAPVESFEAFGGPQGSSIVVEWPLPGMADWIDAPREGHRWQVASDQLFDTNSDRAMPCDDWLAQQVVIFDRKGISLHELFRTVANYDGAHAVNPGLLAVGEGETPSKSAKQSEVHLLRSLAFFGVGYADLVVVEAAMYLYERLRNEPTITRPRRDILIAKSEFECSAEQAVSLRPDWLRFSGGMTVSFSATAGVERHIVRPVGP